MATYTPEGYRVLSLSRYFCLSELVSVYLESLNKVMPFLLIK